MLQNLAATIRSALETTTGQGRPPQQQPSTATSTSGRSMSNDTNLEDLRWRPATGLQLTVKAGQLVQSAAAALPPKQRQELAASGPQVQTSAVPGSPTPTTAAASKPKALAKQTRAPSLDPVAAAKDAKRSKPETAGKQWFDLPAVKITDEVKRDLRLLRLRGAYDPKRFYRSFDETKFPKHFAVSTKLNFSAVRKWSCWQSASCLVCCRHSCAGAACAATLKLPQACWQSACSPDTKVACTTALSSCQQRQHEFWMK